MLDKRRINPINFKQSWLWWIIQSATELASKTNYSKAPIILNRCMKIDVFIYICKIICSVERKFFRKAQGEVSFGCYKAKFILYHNLIISTSKAWIQAEWVMGWGKPSGERLGSGFGWKAQYDSAVCIWNPEIQLHPGLHQVRHDQQVEWRDYYYYLPSIILLFWQYCPDCVCK